MTRDAELRAEAARPPQPTPALEHARIERQEHQSLRERVERRSIVRGLLLLALAALGISIARAGLDRVFVHGWWRQW